MNKDYWNNYYQFNPEPIGPSSFAIFVLEQIKDGVLLELGCGRGEFLKGFSDIGIDCYGVDLSDYAKKICPTADISKVNLLLEELPFQDNFFDFIYSKSFIGHQFRYLSCFVQVQELQTF